MPEFTKNPCLKKFLHIINRVWSSPFIKESYESGFHGLGAAFGVFGRGLDSPDSACWIHAPVLELPGEVSGALDCRMERLQPSQTFLRPECCTGGLQILGPSGLCIVCGGRGTFHRSRLSLCTRKE